uniref:Uncharacterized protein n=1 Tax=Branchiostoma floridae TaxID=7739 RepID=C3XT02_BRAFL|eukprot:XP_002612726.1 hypothetical protein BRAFLDRAFT_97295 [Branchiostoma floridae]
MAEIGDSLIEIDIPLPLAAVLELIATDMEVEESVEALLRSEAEHVEMELTLEGQEKLHCVNWTEESDRGSENQEGVNQAEDVLEESTQPGHLAVEKERTQALKKPGLYRAVETLYGVPDIAICKEITLANEVPLIVRDIQETSKWKELYSEVGFFKRADATLVNRSILPILRELRKPDGPPEEDQLARFEAETPLSAYNAEEISERIGALPGEAPEDLMEMAGMDPKPEASMRKLAHCAILAANNITAAQPIKQDKASRDAAQAAVGLVEDDPLISIIVIQFTCVAAHRRFFSVALRGRALLVHDSPLRKLEVQRKEPTTTPSEKNGRQIPRGQLEAFADAHYQEIMNILTEKSYKWASKEVAAMLATMDWSDVAITPEQNCDAFEVKFCARRPPRSGTVLSVFFFKPGTLMRLHPRTTGWLVSTQRSTATGGSSNNLPGPSSGKPPTKKRRQMASSDLDSSDGDDLEPSQGCGACRGPCPIAPSMCTLHHHDVRIDSVRKLSAGAARDAGACRGPCPIAPYFCMLHHHDVPVDNVTKLSASAARDTGACRGPCPIVSFMCTLHHHDVHVDNVTNLSASAARDTGAYRGPCPIAPPMCTLHHHDVNVDNVTNFSASAARDTGTCRGPCPITAGVRDDLAFQGVKDIEVDRSY